MNKPTCTLTIFVTKADVPFMMETIPHLVRMCNFPFSDRILIIDTGPLAQLYDAQKGEYSEANLRECCAALIEQKVMDRMFDIDYNPSVRARTYKKHLGRVVRETKDYRGVPNLGRMFAIDQCSTDYLVHFDSDMMLYQKPGHDWISEGMHFFEANPDIISIAPLAGPPLLEKKLHQGATPYHYDERGYYVFKDFSSRDYMINIGRFEKFLPLTPRYVSWKRRLAGYLNGKSALQSWEYMISEKLRLTNFIRADLANPNAYTLHPVVHDDDFAKAIPALLPKVESGWFPPEQAGHYDIHLNDWQSS